MDSSEEMENEDDVVSGEGGEEERTETVENLNEEVEDKVCKYNNTCVETFTY